ncbi:hypothetical protein MOQ_005060 [Trypanosoma cruzi marinkellei]|uniref:Uncharacterized protein n=1 Tax=Trypanosoma cruzi marinkellei TaxID=85056 RepID=K2MZF3_TRYCR|nr:hypothetical protein MOQ_005060 [Trypanosoma cruzi marinkellei]
MAAIDISASLDAIREKARKMLETAATRNGHDTSDGSVVEIDDARMALWHEELIVLRDHLLDALMASQQGRQARAQDEAVRGDGTVVEPDTSSLRRTSHEMLLHAVFGEWVALWASDKDAHGGLASESLIDIFLDGIVYTHAAKWNGEEAEETTGGTMRDVVWMFVKDIWGMTPIEQEKLLPRLVQHAWEAFIAEMQRLEEDVQRVCTAVGSSNAELGAQERQGEARTLVTNAVRVLKMLASSSTPAEAASMRDTSHAHVLVATSAKARRVVQMIGRWLPVCCDFLHTLTPRQDNDRKEENAIGKCPEGNNKECSDTAATPEAVEWIRQLKGQVERVLRLLAQLDETSPWILMFVDMIARAFYVTSKDKLQTNGDADAEVRQHMALKSFLTSYEKSEDVPHAAVSAGHLTLAEACNMKISHVLSCALDKTGCPSSLSTRVLRVLLVQRPLATLRHLLNFLCPGNNVAALCDCEPVITDKGSASDARSMAFMEEPLQENAVARTFFPKFFSVFRAIEQALGSLCEDLTGHDSDADAVSLILDRFLAAAMDKVFTTGFAQEKGVAASEWLMFLAFICHDTPLFDVHALHHVRNAARRFFAPGRPMISYLHEQIVKHGRHGLTAFFLPPLRAIGVDYSTSSDHEHLGCALRYPLSAEVAYFQELPRGYYCRQPLRLALNAKNDALHFFHDLLMPPVADVLPKNSSMVERKLKEEDQAAARDIFVDIIVHIGILVLARVRGDADFLSMADTVTADAMSSLFFGVLRLCSSVTYWDAARRHEIQRAIVKQLCAQSPAASTPTAISGNKRQNGGSHRVGEKTAPLPVALLLRGGCTQGDGDAEAGDVSEGKTEVPHAWHDWFCNVELEDIDARAGVSAMTLLRICNRGYMKVIPTRTLLERRATLEQHARKQKESGSSEKVESAMVAAILRDVDRLRGQRDGNAGTPTNPKDQPSVKETVSAGDKMKAENGVEENGTAAVVKGEKSDEKKGEREIPIPKPNEKPLPIAVVKPYIEAMVVTLMQRARISVVDGVAAGVALKKWLMAISGRFEPQALLEVVRRVVLQANTKLTHATKLECASLSAFLGAVAEDIVLPYKLCFLSLNPTHTKQQRQQGTEPAETKEKQNINEWLHKALPPSEKDAGMLLRVLIADTTRAVTRFLEHATPLGDWKAYILTFHMRRIMGLLARYESAYRAALAKRLQQLGTTSVVMEGTHPVQLLAAVECPLLEKMTRPAADVDHLFTSATSAAQESPVPLTSSTSGTQMNSTAALGGGNGSNTGRKSWSKSVDASKRKRQRSSDNSHSHRHGRRRNGPRDQEE